MSSRTFWLLAASLRMSNSSMQPDAGSTGAADRQDRLREEPMRVVGNRIQVVLAALLLLPASCSVRPAVEVFNNTASVARVTLRDKTVEIAPKESQSFVWQELMPIEVEGRGFPHLAIGRIPRGYMKTGFFRAKIRVQLEPGGILLLLRPGTEFPANSAVSQPEGWPAYLSNALSNKRVQPTAASGRG